MKTIQTWKVIGIASATFLAGVALVAGRNGVLNTASANADRGEVFVRPVGNTSSENMDSLQSLDQSMVALADFAKPAVVHIKFKGERSTTSNGMRVPGIEGDGSGFIYRKDGYIITNDHVAGAKGQVTVVLSDGREFPGKVTTAPYWDVAVVKIDATNLPTLPMADSRKVKQGQVVMAVGSPFGLENSVSFGHVSGIGRQNSVPDNSSAFMARNYAYLIQTDAAINQGNSGGPLININGQVIGMNSTIFSLGGGSNGIGFSIPSNEVKLIADQLIANGSLKQAYLGVNPVDMKPVELQKLGIPGGARLESVSPDSPAAAGGLKDKDIVLAIAGTAVADQLDVRRAMLIHAPGTQVKIDYLRDGQRRSATVKLETYNPERLARNSAPRRQQPNMDEFLRRIPDMNEGQDDTNEVEPLRSGKAKLGVSIAAPGVELRSQYNIPKDVTGVVITMVEEGSAASRAGMKVGDVILKIGGEAVTSPDQITEAMSNVNWGGSIKVKTVRFGPNSRIEMERDVKF